MSGAPGADGAARRDPAVPVIGAVVIGRNEGARLVACLASIPAAVARVVYVDSGSTDGSPAAAQAAGAVVVALDPALPFTAARGRNAGFAALMAGGPVDLVQFIDGDCRLQPGWIETARDFLLAHPRAAVVCGRRRERFPEASVYNRLCDAEWDTPVGQAKACGGDALMRAAAVAAAGGYRDDVIAAEDDEFCQRLIAAGWEVWRLDAEMTLHDAAMTRLSQWWRRAVRAGHGFAQVGGLHPGHFVAPRRRMWVWGLVLPVVAIAGLFWQPWLALGVAALYATSLVRVARRFHGKGLGLREAILCAGLITLSKFPNLVGAARYRMRRLRNDAVTIIEYK
ncbi:MAG TPA: glycosyltransferase [Paracoccaceae bacterium]|mgnify:CR=1 FL=1|nr:glycosyltransferase [Paracoccaceae bacterium]HMO70034.1 glycosyltransferase [Paracoccaceae bacterium]